MLEAARAVFRARLRIYLRYPGWVIMSVVYPIVFAMIPVILGFVLAGSVSEAGNVFYRYAGTREYVLYIILGSTVWSISSSIMWDFGMWLYEEMEMGTLEQLFLTPVGPRDLLLGAISYTIVINLVDAVLGLIIASALLGCLHLVLTLNMLLALGIIVIGFVPLLGMALFFGALVLRIKEPWAFFNFITAFLVYIAGVFYPLSVLPKYFQILAILFPPTIQIADSRAIVLGVEFVFDPFIDVLLLITYGIIWPMLGMVMYKSIYDEARRKGTIGGH